MIYGPNQSDRKISFGKANANFPGTKGSVDELAYVDLDNGNFVATGTLSGTNFSGSSSGTNTGDQTLPTLASLGALSTTGKAADSNLLDGIDSSGFTRKYTFNPGSTASGNRYYVKLFTLDDFDAGVTGILSAAGDYGDADKASYHIQIGTRTSLSFDVYQTSDAGVADDYNFYYRQIANNDYEIWALMADYNKNNQFTVLSQFGTVTYNFDSENTSAPDGLTQVTKHTIYHSGNLSLGTAAATASTAYATSAQGTTADAALPKAGGTMTGTLKLDSELQFLRGAGSGDYSNYIRPQNYPSQNYTSSTHKYWLEYGAKGGHHFVLNTDGGAGSAENAMDDFTIWNGAVDGDRLLEVTNAGNVTTTGSFT